jgi:hypothetical protein
MFAYIVSVFKKLLTTYPVETPVVEQTIQMKTPEELSQMTKREIVDHAAEFGLILNIKTKKDDMIRAFQNFDFNG